MIVENKHKPNTVFHIENTRMDKLFFPLSETGRIAIICQSLRIQALVILDLLFRNKSIALVNPIMAKGQIDILLRECNISAVVTDLDYLFDETVLVYRLSKDKLQSDFSTNERIETENYSIELLDDNQDIIIFSSGSSGRPKAVQLTVKQFKSAYNNSEKLLKYSEKDAWVLSLPLYHVSGFSILFRALYSHATVIIPQDFSSLAIESILIKHPITYISLVPAQLQHLINNNVVPPPTLKLTLLGGAAFENDLVRQALNSGWQPAKVYGSSETAAFITILFPEDFISNPNSVGKPLPNVSLRCERKGLLSDNEYGEIVARSESLAKGYLNNIKQSSEKFVNGEYYTGDAGYIDDEGFLFIKARLDDVINTGGEKVYPAEINSALKSVDGIADCATVGMPDSKWGSAVCSLVVLKKGFEIDEQSLKLQLREKLASFQIPKIIYFADKIPYNEQGKIDRAIVLQILLKSI